ncbi:MAG TPA: hypothetical protein VF544_21200 [Pyrinomonadaceae bacterium]|jgi:hypothetical protein
MTKSDKKPKLQIPTRMAKPKGDMFANLRTREQVETVHFEELVAPAKEPATPSQPIPTHPNPTQPIPTQAIAPARDFNKRANSLDREALVEGLFPGTSQKLYNALYQRTRGAIVPVRTVKATKRELMLWSDIRSKNTIAVNLKILTSIGWIKSSAEPGDHEGAIYEVFIYEELPGTPDPSQPIPTHPNPTQKLGGDPTQFLGWVGMGNPIENKDTYENPKTFFKTNTEKSFDDDDAALAGLVAKLKEAAKEISGKELSPAEKDRWTELADVLIAELKIAAARTTVSNVPAFLAEHLRRRLWKIDQRQAQAEGRELPDQASSLSHLDAKECPDCGGSNWHYPEGVEKGVRRCTHQKLKSENA